jgi:acetylglutamate kinase
MLIIEHEREDMELAIIKISGKSLENFTTGQAGINLIKSLRNKYSSVILIHGGGKIISEWSQKLGIEPNFHEGQRITCKDSMEITAAVQGGLINSKISAYLQTNLVKSIGLNGIDMNLFEAEYFNDKLGFVGNPKPNSDSQWLKDLLRNDIVPVFSSICRDKNGNLMNVNADLFAGAVAELLKADSIFFLSDIEGVKLKGEFQNSLSVNDLHSGLSTGEITDGMIPKINTCINLLKSGISKIWIGNDLNQNEKFMKGTWIGQYE